MVVLRLFLFIALALTPLAAQAHEAKGPNGGSMVDVAGGHLEMVLSGTALTFYLTDEAVKPRNVAQFKGRALIQTAGKTAQAELSPEAPNALKAKTEAAVIKGSVVVVTGMLDGKPLQARFTVK